MLRISVGRGHRGASGNHGVDQLLEAPGTRANGYARCEDFRALFLENLDCLYQLSLLLTSDPYKAEQCLIGAFDECVRSQQIFRAWALCWAKRTLIQHAIGAVPSRVDHQGSDQKPGNVTNESISDKEPCFNISALLGLQHFERLAFVLSVLEEYSDRDCAFLLSCSVQEIREARVRALQQLAVSTHKGGSIPVDGIKTELTRIGF